jgi:dihydrofolate synthase/folylpolyglutamate synthase
MSQKPINQSTEEFLASFDKFGIHLGLERIQQLLKSLGNPHQQVPIIHVAGTNGKGSVCAFLLSILQAAGYRVGRYTSPHLLDWRERISINGKWITHEDLLVTLHHVQEAIAPEFPPTQFEVITAAMWWYFAQQKSLQNLDIAIIETGLGGRLDATNVCDRPLICAVTSISLDHCQQLGNTLSAIATEKAGIIKPKCPVVIAENDPEAIAALQAKVIECDAPVTWAKSSDRTATGAIYQGFEYPLPLLGNHQLINSAIAIATIQSLRTQGWEISDDAICSGIAKTEWAGRLQWIEFDLNGKLCKILIDGAHNVAAAKHLRQFIDEAFPNHCKRWIIGILNTKDQDGILKALLHPNDLLFAVPVSNPSTTSSENLAKFATPILKTLPQSFAGLGLGLEAAFEDQRSTDIVVLCGSLYLVGEFLTAICFQNRHK